MISALHRLVLGRLHSDLARLTRVGRRLQLSVLAFRYHLDRLRSDRARLTPVGLRLYLLVLAFHCRLAAAT